MTTLADMDYLDEKTKRAVCVALAAPIKLYDQRLSRIIAQLSDVKPDQVQFDGTDKDQYLVFRYGERYCCIKAPDQ